MGSRPFKYCEYLEDNGWRRNISHSSRNFKCKLVANIQSKKHFNNLIMSGSPNRLGPLIYAWDETKICFGTA